MAFSSEVRENRAFVAEIKFLVPAGSVGALRDWARGRLQPDPYGAGLHGDSYETDTLYFDTANMDVFRRRGSYGRSKYRIRRYGSANLLFLERKLKTRDLVSKRRSTIECRELMRLADPEPCKGWPGHWFHRRIVARDIRPVCQVSYSRTALVHSNGHGSIRLTLDTKLRASQCGELAFRPILNVPTLTGDDAILELKYYREMPPVFQELVARFDLQPQPISKYRISANALSLVEAHS